MKLLKILAFFVVFFLSAQYYFAPTLSSVRTVRVTSENSVGTGVIINDTQILTNKHVVEGHESGVIYTKDGKQSDFTVEYVDPVVDMAILNMTSETDFDSFRQVSLACSVPTIIGTRYYTVGHTSDDPRWAYTDFNYTGALFSFAMEPSLGRHAMLFDSASVNKGNSGGGVFDIFGNHVGIITAIYLNYRETTETSHISLNYTIAVSNKDVCESLYAHDIEFNRTYNKDDFFGMLISLAKTVYYSVDQRIR